MTDIEINSWSEIAEALKNRSYSFTTVTPESHRRLIERNGVSNDASLDIFRRLFGRSLPVVAAELPQSILRSLESAGVPVLKGLVRSPMRFSTLDSLLFMHSAFPTTGADSVFFGPDTYRYVRFLKSKIKRASTVVDIGCGSGAGGIWLARWLQQLGRPLRKLILTDINPKALVAARFNVRINGIENVDVIESDVLKNVRPGADVLIANPPFIIDSSKRAYRDGGGAHGAELSARIVKECLTYLEAGGELAVYTGSCFVQGRDIFHEQLKALPTQGLKQFDYEEIDPDIFGEELSTAAYQDVERIAAIGLFIKK